MNDAMCESMAQTVMYVLWNIHTHDFFTFCKEKAGELRSLSSAQVYNALKIITKFPGKHIYFQLIILTVPVNR